MPKRFEPHVALLRGINVGGANIIPMAALRASFEALGLREVSTYIQSGNVLFSTDLDASRLCQRVEEALSKQFGYQATVVLRSRPQLKRIVERAPDGFGGDPARYRYDVVFLKEPWSARDVLPSIPTRDGVDTAHPGDGVVYFSRLIERATQSYLSRLISLPQYKQMTIRNWNTTTKLLTLMDR
jgi:uncharacterized protein (DUF1697 family)